MDVPLGVGRDIGNGGTDQKRGIVIHAGANAEPFAHPDVEAAANRQAAAGAVDLLILPVNDFKSVRITHFHMQRAAPRIERARDPGRRLAAVLVSALLVGVLPLVAWAR